MGSDLIMRRANAGERQALEDLQRKASLVWEDYREQLLAHPDAIDLPLAQIEAGYVFVAESRGQILGFGMVLPRDDGAPELDGLFVDPSRWRSGIGRALVEHGLRMAARCGARALKVVANPRVVGFYQRCGFATCGEAATRFGRRP